MTCSLGSIRVPPISPIHGPWSPRSRAACSRSSRACGRSTSSRDGSTQEPYETLVLRANLAVRARSARGRPAKQPAYMMRRVLCSSPADGVVEATAIITTPVRTRAVAMRLEGYDGRWRATSLAML